MQGYSNELHRRAMVNEGTKSVLSNKIGEHISIILRRIRSPCTCDVLMAKALGFSDIFEEGFVMAETMLLIMQRELPSNEDVVRLSWEMHTIPRLETHGWR